jgi:hypothetical protein
MTDGERFQAVYELLETLEAMELELVALGAVLDQADAAVREALA